MIGAKWRLNAINGMNIDYIHINQVKVYELLIKSSDFFFPPLSEEVDLEKYSCKLSEYADFILYREKGSPIGYIAYYKNYQAKQIYIPLICVHPKYQQSGIGTKMLRSLENTFKDEYSTIGLEVVKRNRKAYNFYIKQGFSVKEDRGIRTLMVKNI